MYNDKNPKYKKCSSCQDPLYLIITTILFIAILIYSIINFNPTKLY